MTQSQFELGGVQVHEKLTKSNHRIVEIELIRERALNALLPETFECFNNIIDSLESSSQPAYLIFRGKGRAFSAGGDVRSLRNKGLNAGNVNTSERAEAAAAVLLTEYDFMKRLRRLPSNIISISLANGYTFGAGMGLFQACSIRLLTNNAILSMPEIRIGLIPDCGSTYSFANMPGSTGMYAALTGARILSGDALILGLADAGVSTEWSVEHITEEVVSKQAVFSSVGKIDAQLPRTELATAESSLRRAIDHCFSVGSVVEVLEETKKFEDKEEEWAKVAMKAMTESSPRALAAAFDTMRGAYREQWDVFTAIDREYEVEKELVCRHDFEEGVRALLVDKDNRPQWEPYQFER